MFATMHTKFNPSPRSISHLPNEILANIFHFAAHDASDVNDAISVPIAVSAVSPRWRTIALAHGRLWTTIVLTFPGDPEESRLAMYLTRASAWLRRSQSFPLDIILDFRDPDWDWDDKTHGFQAQDMENVLRLILPQVARWKTFNLLTDTWEPMFTFLWYSQHVTSAPHLLESVSLSRCNAYLAIPGQPFVPTNLKASIPLFGGREMPKLQAVTLSGVHIDWETSYLKNLTKLRFEYHASEVMPTVKQFADILASCPDLQELAVIGWGPVFDETVGSGSGEGHGTATVEDIYTVPANSTAPPISRSEDATASPDKSINLPHLTSFAFGFLDIGYAFELLSLFSLPSLRHFSIEDVAISLIPRYVPDANPLLLCLSQQHRPQHGVRACKSHDPPAFPLSAITSLSLSGISASQPTFSQFFSQFVSLEKLTLSDVDVDALRALGARTGDVSASGGFACPVLAELAIRHCADIAVLTEMVSTRSSHPSVAQLTRGSVHLSNTQQNLHPAPTSTARSFQDILATAGFIIFEDEDNHGRRPSTASSNLGPELVESDHEDDEETGDRMARGDREPCDVDDSGFAEDFDGEEEREDYASPGQGYSGDFLTGLDKSSEQSCEKKVVC